MRLSATTKRYLSGAAGVIFSVALVITLAAGMFPVH